MPGRPRRLVRMARALLPVAGAALVLYALFGSGRGSLPQGDLGARPAAGDRPTAPVPGTGAGTRVGAGVPADGQPTRPARATEPEDEFAEAARPPRRPGTEKAAAKAFLALEREDRAAFEQAIRETLGTSDAPLPRKIGALRAACEKPSEESLALVGRILEDERAHPDLRRVGIRVLSESARSDDRARRVVMDLVAAQPADAEFRLAVYRAALLSGSEADLTRCFGYLYNEPDPELVGAAAASLARREWPSARDALGRLRDGHPSAEARHRIEEERTGERCDKHALPSQEE